MRCCSDYVFDTGAMYLTVSAICWYIINIYSQLFILREQNDSFPGSIQDQLYHIVLIRCTIFFCLSLPVVAHVSEEALLSFRVGVDLDDRDVLADVRGFRHAAGSGSTLFGLVSGYCGEQPGTKTVGKDFVQLDKHSLRSFQLGLVSAVGGLPVPALHWAIAQGSR